MLAGRKDVSTDMFLGHLCPIDEYRVYGYMTSTRLKLLAVLEDVNDIREPDLKKVNLRYNILDALAECVGVL